MRANNSRIGQSQRPHKRRIVEIFEPDAAEAYLSQIEFVAECELSYLTSQCLKGRRIDELEKLQTEIATWANRTTVKQRGID